MTAEQQAECEMALVLSVITFVISELLQLVGTLSELLFVNTLI